jgi:hypothetical protein
MMETLRILAAVVIASSWLVPTLSVAQTRDEQPDEQSSSAESQPPDLDLSLPEVPDNELPQLSDDEPVYCLEGEGDRVYRFQIDEKRRRVLVAESHLRRDGRLTGVIARELRTCQRAELGALDRLRSKGYEVVAALLEAPRGFKRDRRGRLFQTHFDLRRRLKLGIFDGMVAPLDTSGETLTHSFAGEFGAIYEVYDASDQHRHRFRFLEGRLRLTPFEADLLAFSYDRGQSGEEPTFWITTFIGPPTRFDIDLHLGPGVRLGQINIREFVDRGTLTLADILQGHINWDPIVGAGLEDYLVFRLGGGLGVTDFRSTLTNPRLRREDPAVGDPQMYLYPYAGFEWSWLIGDRGLTQIRARGDARVAFEPSTSRRWFDARASVSFERVLLAITDQPLSIFVEPQARYLQMGERELSLGEVRLLLGARLSFFTPPRPRYEPDGGDDADDDTGRGN